jgi:hypothetical protein
MSRISEFWLTPNLSLVFGEVANFGSEEKMNSYGYALGVGLQIPIGLMNCNEAYYYQEWPNGKDPFTNDKLVPAMKYEINPMRAHTIAAVYYQPDGEPINLRSPYKRIILRQDCDMAWSYWDYKTGVASDKDFKGEVIYDPMTAYFSSSGTKVFFYQLPDKPLLVRTYAKVLADMELDHLQ